MTKDDIRATIAQLYQIDQDLETLFMVKSSVRKLILELTAKMDWFLQKEELSVCMKNEAAEKAYKKKKKLP